jgi:hypothetical protein
VTNILRRNIQSRDMREYSGTWRRRSGEERGREWSKATTRNVNSYQKLKRQGRFVPRAFRGSMACPHPDFRLLTSRILTE